MHRPIVSIASSPGWKARFLRDAEPDGVQVVTLIAWALVEDSEGKTEVVGLIQRSPTGEAPHGWLGLADEVEGFQGYTFTGLATRAPES